MKSSIYPHHCHFEGRIWTALKEVHERDTTGNKIRLLRDIVVKVAHEGDNIQAHIDGIVEKFNDLEQEIRRILHYHCEKIICEEYRHRMARDGESSDAALTVTNQVGQSKRKPTLTSFFCKKTRKIKTEC